MLQEEHSLLRETLQEEMRCARKRGDGRAESVIKLIQTALNERDVCARQSGLGDEISDSAILTMIDDMIDQRRADMVRAEEAGRLDRAEKERQEIEILTLFLPRKLSSEEVDGAVEHAIEDLGANCIKDTGRVMARLKKQFGGTIDSAQAKRIVCERLRRSA